MPDFTYDTTTHAFRGEDGFTISPEQIAEWRAEGQDDLEEKIAALTSRLVRGEITIQYWEIQIQTMMRNAMITAFLLGIGGVNNWNRADKEALGAILSSQYEYLRNFARDIANGNLSEAAARARANMYIRAAQRSISEATAREWGVDMVLPGWPGVDTICLSNCGCSWGFEEEVTEDEDGTERHTIIATWHLGKEDNCATCLQRSHEWRGLRFAVDT